MYQPINFTAALRRHTLAAKHIGPMLRFDRELRESVESGEIKIRDCGTDEDLEIARRAARLGGAR